jgi:hypothetical protein
MALLKSLARRMAVEKDEEIWLMEHPKMKVWVVRKARKMRKGLRSSLMAHKKLMVPEKELQMLMAHTKLTVPEKELQMENSMDVVMALKWVQLMVEKRSKVC